MIERRSSFAARRLVRAQRWAVAFLSALGVTSVSAQVSPLVEVPGLRSLYDRALLVDADYAVARAAHDADAQSARVAAAAFSPTVTTSATADITHSARKGADAVGSQELTLPALGWRLQFSKPLYSLDREGFRAENEIRAARAVEVLNQARQDLLFRLAQAVFNFLLAQDQVVLARAQADAVQAQLRQVEALLASRSATRTDAADARARFEVAQAQIGLAESQLEVRRLELVRMVGQPLPDELKPLQASPDLPAPQPADPQAWIDRARQGSPKVAALEWSVRLAEASMTRARAATKPTLSLLASSAIQASPNSAVSREHNNSVGLQLSMTLFDGGVASAQVDQASFLRERARHELESARLEVGVAAGQAYWGFVNGARQMRAMEEAVRAAELTLEGTRLGIQASVKTFADELNAVQLLFSTRRDLQRERYALLYAALQLEVFGEMRQADVAGTRP